MKVFQELTIHGKPKAIESFLDSLVKPLPSGWRCDESLAGQTDDWGGVRRWYFHCSGTDAHPQADLWLVLQEPGRVVIGNIVSKSLPWLTRDQYNTILKEFLSECLEPNKTPDLHFEVTEADVGLDKWLTPPAIRKLEVFSHNANRSVPHPLDTELWREFLIQVHRDRSQLPADMLQMWFVEEQRWPEDRAFDLIVQYEQARDLLRDYDDAIEDEASS